MKDKNGKELKVGDWIIFSGGIEQIRGFSSIDYNLIAIINIGIYTTWRFGEEIWLAENDEILIHKLEA